MIAETRAYGLTFRYPAADTIIGPCLRDHGEFGRVEAALAAQLARGGSFLDVGANIGAISLPVATRVRRVVAVEAHPGLADLLRQNVQANNLDNVEVLNAAVSDAAGVLPFATPDLAEARNFGDNSLRYRDAPLVDVEARTVDQLAPDDLKVVKVDVQGAEKAVLQGSARTLEAIRPVWIIEVGKDSPQSRENIQFLQSKGYAVYWFFSPFVTRLSPRNQTSEGAINGDINVAAFPGEGPQPRDMTRVDLSAPWPSHPKAFPYLTRYGFASA